MYNYNGIIGKVVSLPRSLYYSIKCCGIKNGIKLPILIHFKAKIQGLNKNSFSIPGDTRFRFGFCASKGIPTNARSAIYIAGGVLQLKGSATIGEGSVIRIDAGSLILGDDFAANNNCEFYCSKRIEIGDSCLLGWNTAIRDSDGHHVSLQGEDRPNIKAVTIGNSVWVGAHVDIMKGTEIGDGSVIGFRSCVVGLVADSNSLIGGYPARIIRRNISWRP